MSDLLTNMAARSQGVAPAIRPHVPSLYEPYRQETGLLGARQVSGEIDLESPRENDSQSNGVSGAAIPLDRLDQPSEPPQQPRQNSPASIAETRREPIVSPRLPQTALRADSSPVLPSTSTESTQQPADVSTSWILPPATPIDETYRSQIDATLAPAGIRPLHRLQSAPSAPAPSPDAATSDSLATPGRSRTLPSRLEGSSSSRQLSPHPAPAPKPEETRPGLTTTKPIQPMHPEQVFMESVRPESLPELVSSVTPAVSGIPPAMPLDSSVRRGFPKETPPLSGIAVHPAAANQSSEPSIRVTIGKVEVRAVFPPTPVNRTPPQRVRPTLSLDDFLKRNSGAGR
jgi:hypothetical protein